MATTAVLAMWAVVVQANTVQVNAVCMRLCAYIAVVHTTLDTELSEHG